MQSTTLQRGAEERKVTLYENGDSYLITVTVLAIAVSRSRSHRNALRTEHKITS